MIGIRGGIDKWAESESSTQHKKIKDNMSPEDVLDSDLDVELSQFENNSSNSKFYDDSPQVKYNPLSHLFNKSEINNNLQKPANEIPSSNWTYKSQQSNSRQERNMSSDIPPSLNDTVHRQQPANTKINPLIGLSSDPLDGTNIIKNNPSSNWLLNPKHRLSQNNLSLSGHELSKNVSSQIPLENVYRSYGSENLNYYEENLRYNENYTAENQDDYEQHFYDDKYNDNYVESRNSLEYKYNRERIYGDDQDWNNTNSQNIIEENYTSFSPLSNEISKDNFKSHTRDEYKDITANYNNYGQYESIRIYRKTRRQRNQESKLGQKRMSLLNRTLSDSSYDGNHKTILPSLNYSCDEMQSLSDTRSKYFKLSATTIPPTGNSLPPLPEPDYDLSGATFYIPPPDY